MKKTILFSTIIFLCLIGGIILYSVTNDWIIFHFPGFVTSYFEQQKTGVHRKIITLTFWNNNRWESETTQMIWTDKTEYNTKNLTNNWLSLLDEEGIIKKKVTVQSTALSKTKNECYLSFDQTPFAKEDSTFKKLMLTEGLLKTLKENDIPLQSIHFLVHHKILNDNHLDFTNPWPIEGFLNETE